MDIVAHTDGVTPLHLNLPIPKTPGAAKIVRVPEPLAKPLAHLLLHEHDLKSASVFLAEFENLGGAAYADDTSTTVGATALWYAALNAVMKCFSKSNRRVKLDPAAIFGETSEGNEDRNAFNILKSLRDKNIAHDDNDWLQAMPAAILSEPGNATKVIDMTFAIVNVDSAYPENIERLRFVVTKCGTWVHEERLKETKHVRSTMESWERDELFALPDARGNLADTASVHKNRPH